MNPLTIACQFSKDLELIKLLITKISINRQESDEGTLLVLSIKYNKNMNIIKKKIFFN
ncbi:hypothetical protein U3516DRAFT_909354 [Neocallimastix sp. 'constans']|jgi:hypothetical protein